MISPSLKAFSGRKKITVKGQNVMPAEKHMSTFRLSEAHEQSGAFLTRIFILALPYSPNPLFYLNLNVTII